MAMLLSMTGINIMPDAPSALTVTMVTATSITITWTQSSHIDMNSHTCTLSEGVQLVQYKA